MKAKLKKRGKSTSAAEIQNISLQGIWFFVKDREFFLPFADYPWFRKATIDQIYNFTFEHGKHLHWPALDVDVDIEALKNPGTVPLIYQ